MNQAHEVTDQLNRPLRDLRISVTDRCNFRCPHCMPAEYFGRDFPFLPKSEVLTFEEIEQLARIFVQLGVRKLRLTGGEPLLRADLDKLIRMLAQIPGVEDLALTTNGVLLEEKAEALRAAGLHRLTVSLNALDPGIFAAMSGSQIPVERVLAGIDAAVRAGFPLVKINAMVKRGVNESEIVPLARRFRARGFVLRFIEYMDVGNHNGWNLQQVVPGKEILERIAAVESLERVAAPEFGEVASRWKYPDGGEIGFITSVTQPFCRGCTRARLSSEGKLYTCLFSGAGFDLRGPLRAGTAPGVLRELIGGVWNARQDRYSELRSNLPTREKVEMSRVGG